MNYDLYLFTVNRKGFTSKLINFGMKVRGFLTQKGTRPPGSHTEIVFLRQYYNKNGSRVIIESAGAVITGGEMRPLARAMKEKWTDWQIYTPALEYSEQQFFRCYNQAKSWTQGPEKVIYSYINFFTWARFILTGRWRGETGTRLQNCWEMSTRLIRVIWPGYCAQPFKKWKKANRRGELLPDKRLPAEMVDIFDMVQSGILRPLTPEEEIHLLQKVRRAQG